MIKSILVLITKVLESRLVKSGVETEILKNQNLITEAKNVWNMVNENDRISTSIEAKLKSKAEQFDAALLKKFPELTQDDIANLRQSIAGEVNKDKQAVVDNSTLLQQLQNTNTQLQAENVSLKDQVSKVQSLVAIAANATQVTDNNQVPVGSASNAGNVAQVTDTNQVPVAQTNNATIPGQVIAQA